MSQKITSKALNCINIHRTCGKASPFFIRWKASMKGDWPFDLQSYLYDQELLYVYVFTKICIILSKWYFIVFYMKRILLSIITKNRDEPLEKLDPVFYAKFIPNCFIHWRRVRSSSSGSVILCFSFADTWSWIWTISQFLFNMPKTSKMICN